MSRLTRSFLLAALAVAVAPPGVAARSRCERITAQILAPNGAWQRRCEGLSGQRHERCMQRKVGTAIRRVRRACGRDAVSAPPPPTVCGDGLLTGTERCDASAPSNGGCDDTSTCIACLTCSVTCGDGRIGAGEVCEDVSSCPPGHECVGCRACGLPVPPVVAEDDVSPCRSGIGDRWTFDVRAGTAVTIAVDTRDAATAAKLALEGTCPSAGSAPVFFRAAVGAPCTFPPPNHPNPGYDCPRWRLFAPADGSCSVTVGVVPRLDVGTGIGCGDPTIAGYRLSVGGTKLVLAGDDVPPGLLSD